MVVYRSGTKGDLERRCRKQPANLLPDVIKEVVPHAHISKAERANIVDSFKDLYQSYWANS